MFFLFNNMIKQYNVMNYKFNQILMIHKIQILLGLYAIVGL